MTSLAPGYFAITMASGIISVGSHLEGYEAISLCLMWFAIASFVVVLALTATRFVRHRPEFLADFTDARRGFGYFTFIAAANVLAVRVGMHGERTLMIVLFTIAAITGLGLSYALPWSAVLGQTMRPVLASANGSWFVWVVASQSVATVAAVIERDAGSGRDALSLVAMLSWSVGLFLYGAAGILVALRMLLYDLRPADLTESYWVAMGACAITVLASTRILIMTDAPVVRAAAGLIAGVAVVFWAFATWLVPVLIAETWWRYWHHRVPWRYDEALWSMVFPLGMYAVAAIDLGRVERLPVIENIGSVESWVALAVFVYVFGAMCVHVTNTVFRGHTVNPGAD
ncbi:tellurite resistance protein TehA-like permease [Antricoccus suffuscus]|uniref:Tellurite resistance protein TehA-like permease n=1 Tax=Antricoccus suffuscus TaxID=1629062 RepID=A0A2T0ZWI7_9ACTN|nr:tellurite resistance protein TehA-like permease [Antricoccus suffuscus]